MPIILEPTVAPEKNKSSGYRYSTQSSAHCRSSLPALLSNRTRTLPYPYLVQLDFSTPSWQKSLQTDSNPLSTPKGLLAKQNHTSSVQTYNDSEAVFKCFFPPTTNKHINFSKGTEIGRYLFSSVVS